ncbi:FAD-binding protein [Polymorphobacter fuscus]|uniref:FAD-binding protein n=1 Tax=Sandarakinorhabdus fusca TaxID=1439888 RepID=A0A7C9KYC5_9SPHN|nr:FAD-binding protein [Polymorphobacter fuscus]KAB7647546.1 FAD-binding protein [Polymorphobacter fuscus]MQT16808.1 FAD-binding protein [Polymorphobacter fuscus]NJC09203.1 FAD/FMN-containing dehydrogenase [Polymorphobacter fuscus]
MAKTIFYDSDEWSNFHLSVRGVPIAGVFELHNSSGAASLVRMAESAAAVQALVGRAFAERRRLRAQGAAWSFSDVAAVPGGWMLNTGYANWLYPLPPAQVQAGFDGDRDGLLLCQTGISVAEINMFLEPRGRSLATTGASNGQTFVGAMSTSTHGSAIDQPAIQGQVRGFQLIPSPDRNLWVEPARRPVTDGTMAAALGATLVRDDRLFDAALVGLGAFGVIHSVLIESVPHFHLVMNRRKLPITPGLLTAMRGQGFDGIDLPGPAGRPYFFQSVLNRHIDRDNGYVTVGHKVAWDPAVPLTYDIVNKRAPGYNLAVVVANMLTVLPGLTQVITKAVLADQLSDIHDRKASWGQSFNFTTPRAGQAGSSMAVPADRATEALELLERTFASVPRAPAAFACRYATRSPGLLAFQRFDRTAIIDIDGLDSKATRTLMAAGVAAMRANGIPHAEHWGKLNQLTAQSVRDSYQGDLERWMKARTDLLDRDGEYCFGSAFLDRLGMTDNRH